MKESLDDAATHEWVVQILEHLAMAFGGHSQYSTREIGRALAGQMNNNGLRGDPEQLAAFAAAELAMRWDDNREEEDAAEIAAACQESLATLGDPHA